MATPAQIKAINTLGRRNGLTLSDLREAVKIVTGSASLHSLSFDQAGAMIDRMGGVDKPRVVQPKSRPRRLKDAIAPASAAQIAYIIDLLCQVQPDAGRHADLLRTKFDAEVVVEIKGAGHETRWTFPVLSSKRAHEIIGGLQSWIRNNLDRALREATS